MEDNSLRRTLIEEYRDDIVVRIAVMDHQGLIEFPRKVDVPTEGLVLDRLTLALGGTEVVQAGLTDRAHHRVPRQIVDASPGCFQSVSPLANTDASSVVGMQRHPHRHIRVFARKGNRPFGRFDVATDLHDLRHADLLRPRQ